MTTSLQFMHACPPLRQQNETSAQLHRQCSANLDISLCPLHRFKCHHGFRLPARQSLILSQTSACPSTAATSIPSRELLGNYAIHSKPQLCYSMRVTGFQPYSIPFAKPTDPGPLPSTLAMPDLGRLVPNLQMKLDVGSKLCNQQ
jgi:hypothetical protein